MASKATPKKKTTCICRSCFDDESLDAKDQFGKPRGFDIRGQGRGRYCGTCGESHWLKQIKL